jgi:hypothetical protein
MPDNDPWAAVDVELDPKAAHKARQYVNNFALALILQAKTLAFTKRAQVVTLAHMDHAFEILNENSQQAWLRLFATLIGSAFFGAFVQGFLSELMAGQAYLMAAYTGLGFVGLLLVLWGLRR